MTNKVNVEAPSLLTGLIRQMELGGYDRQLKVTKNSIYDNYWSVELFQNNLPAYSVSGLTDSQYWHFRNMFGDYFTAIDLALDIDRV